MFKSLFESHSFYPRSKDRRNPASVWTSMGGCCESIDPATATCCVEEFLHAQSPSKLFVTKEVINPDAD